MREVISVHIGQAGVQLGGICWELYCKEHSLDLGGNRMLNQPNTDNLNQNHGSNLNESPEHPRGPDEPEKSSTSVIRGDHQENVVVGGGFHSFFVEMSKGNYSPRTVLVDLEPTVVDEIRTGRLKDLFAPSNCINGVEDAANNYARGHYTAGAKILEQVLEPIRRMAENCEKLQGFLEFHSFGGGTGSGFSALLTEHFNKEYGKKSKLEVAIFPSPTMSTAVVEPYNAVLTTSYTLDHTDCVFLADNEAMYNICMNQLDIDTPNYANLNHLLAQTVSSITASLRFQGTLNADFTDFQTNLVPFPRIHFPVVSYAPIVSRKKCSHQTLSIADITSKCFDTTNRLVKCDNEAGHYMSCCLLYRGDVTSKDVNHAISQIKTKRGVNFVDWSPTGFKVGINSSCPTALDSSDMVFGMRAACMICNTTSIKNAWSRLNSKYHVMLKKKAFTHWFTGEGMEMSEFLEAQDNVLTLEEEYELLMTDKEH
ncbi:hypothetical protein GE061_004608 [Apolygus lucorum]|uniref:Tubulin alpha chain n=1 Tax=Apolygus lucorum TaxID=248454 RepID=A0A6A4INM2_APOLU|nr:hypothetical protein GE061_004608 [Apolygus lucorum]